MTTLPPHEPHLAASDQSLAASVLTFASDHSALWSWAPCTNEGDLLALRRLLSSLSLDKATFYGRYSCTQDELTESAEAALLSPAAKGELQAGLAVLVVFAKSIDLSARLADAGESPTLKQLGELDALCGQTPSFSSLLKLLVGFKDMEQFHISLDDFEWTTLSLHRIGTTSIIFSLRTRGVGGSLVALKISHVLFRSVGPIASATQDYFNDWARVSKACPHAVRVIGSGAGWVLEEFIHGLTLKEFISAKSQAVSNSYDELELLQLSFLPIIPALASLHEATSGLGHGDLTATNIILQERNEQHHPWLDGVNYPHQYVARFIDMGRNLLTSTRIGRVASAEAGFIAPEVRALGPEIRAVPASADYYSLGRLLVGSLGEAADDGFYALPQQVFRDRPALARVSAQLLDEDPDQRLHVSPPGPEGALSLNALEKQLTAAAHLLSEVERSAPVRRDISELRLFRQSLTGSWSDVARSLRLVIHTLRNEGNVPAWCDRLSAARVLAAACSFALGIVILTYSLFLDLNWDPSSIGPAFDWLGFDRGEGALNWQVRLVGGTFLVACFQYNVAAFGGVSFRSTRVPRALRLLSEVLLWSLTFVVLAAIGISLFMEQTLWPWAAAAGLSVVMLNNIVSMACRRWIDERLRAQSSRYTWYKSSWVVRYRDYDILAYWTPTMLVYSLCVWFLAFVIGSGIARDIGVYAGAISIVNAVVLSYSQATRQGDKVRSTLNQYAIAGERVRLDA